MVLEALQRLAKRVYPNPNINLLRTAPKVKNLPSQEGEIMKQKTHSGAKKRFRVKPSGKIKRKRPGMRHLLSHMSSKRKRQLGSTEYVDPANEYQLKRQLVL